MALFKKLLEDGVVDGNEDNDAAIRKCHRHGWIHAELTVDEPIMRYALSSPLRAVLLSWRLEPTNEMPHFTTLYDLALDAIFKFKPSRLHLPICRVGPSSTDRLPEAQYQDEFYRSVFATTSGNVRIFPGFASARREPVAGRNDFFIPVVKWGIELTRDGDQLDEHSYRAAVYGGTYEASLKSDDMDDYILLDCRTTVPKESFPSINVSLLANSCADIIFV